MTKLNLSDVDPLLCLLFVFFLIGILTGGYLATHNTEKGQDCQCQCSCCVKESDETKYFCCGVDAYMIPNAYTTKGSLWFEDKKAGKLEMINDSVTDFNVIRLVFALETEFNYLSIHKLGEFNFKIKFDEGCDEIQLRLWRKE